MFRWLLEVPALWQFLHRYRVLGHCISPCRYCSSGCSGESSDLNTGELRYLTLFFTLHWTVARLDKDSTWTVTSNDFATRLYFTRKSSRQLEMRQIRQWIIHSDSFKNNKLHKCVVWFSDVVICCIHTMRILPGSRFSTTSWPRYKWSGLDTMVAKTLLLEVFTQRNFVVDFFRQKWILLAKTEKSRFVPPFRGLRGNVHGSSMARWKACGRLPIDWTFFASSHC